MSEKKFETEYSKAWDEFKNTPDYRRCMTTMFEKGILNPYSQNLLRVAFDAGWNLKKGINPIYDK